MSAAQLAVVSSEGLVAGGAVSMMTGSMEGSWVALMLVRSCMAALALAGGSPWSAVTVVAGLTSAV